MINNRRQYKILSPEEIAAGKRGYWSELEICGNVRNLSPSLWRMTHLTALYLNDNNLASIPSNVGDLVNLTALDLSNNKITCLPTQIGELIQLRELYLSNNHLRSLPYELGKCFQVQMLSLNGNPLSKEFIQFLNEPNSTMKLLTYLLDILQVQAPRPPERPWIPMARPQRKTSCLLTVMCYNVLCDKYATRQMYGFCPSWALAWDYRKKMILQEIRHYTADIICLQEVETEQFSKFFLPELKRDGYDGIFSPKSRAKTMGESDKRFVDGCAIFYRVVKFSLEQHFLIEFNQLAMANSEGSDDMLNRVMPKDNIGLAALLTTRDTAWDNNTNSTEGNASHINQPLLVCTAHIHWDPEYCDVKLIQIMMLQHELRHILEGHAQKMRQEHKIKPPVQLLLCGDFNSLPESGVIEYLESGRVSADHPDFKDLPYKSVLPKFCGSDKPNEFTHSFNLRSAYADHPIPFTNYTYHFKGIIDYIFYPKDYMIPLGVLGPLSPDWFKDHKIIGCPHPHVPSDHFPLLAEFEMPPLPVVSSQPSLSMGPTRR